MHPVLAAPVSFPHRCDSNTADRTSLPPEAAESHTHLAHAVIRYLGLTAPEELVPFGINSAAGIVDLISRVRPRFGLNLLFFLREGTFYVLVRDEFYHAHLTVVGTAGRLRLPAGRADQSLVLPERCRRVSAIHERCCEPRTGGSSHRNT